MAYGGPSPRVYVGNLPEDIRAGELEPIFGKHGRIRDITVKGPRGRGPAFAFIEFEDGRGADSSLSEDGKRFDGMPMRVQMSRGSGPRGPGGPGGPGGPRGRPGPGGPPQRTGFRVRVFGLPSSASWQDLKDHMRRVGDVGFTEVDRRGGGVVEFTNEEGMERALRELHRSEFRNRFNDVSTIEVEPERGPGGPRDDRPPMRDDDRAPPPRDFGRDGPAGDDQRRDEDRRDEDRRDDGPAPGPDGGVDASAAPAGEVAADGAAPAAAADEGAAAVEAAEPAPVEEAPVAPEAAVPASEEAPVADAGEPERQE